MNIEKFEFILKLLPHKKQVEFALYCAKDVQCYVKNKKDKKLSTKCLKLVEKWLKDDTSVTQEELIATANSYYATIFNTVSTTYISASIAINATPAANAAYTAAHTASTDYAAKAAANTALNAAYIITNSAPYYTAVDEYNFLNKYYKKLLEMADLDDLEKILYIEMDI